DSKLRENRRMRQLLELDASQKFANLLIQNIVQKSDGVFIWVRLVTEDIVEGLTDGDTLDELQQRLDNIPTELEELYRRIIKNVKKQYIDEAYLLFKIVCVFNDPIPLLQLYLAIQGPEMAIRKPIECLSRQERSQICDEMSRRLRSRCGCILEITGVPSITESNSVWAKQYYSFWTEATNHPPP